MANNDKDFVKAVGDLLRQRPQQPQPPGWVDEYAKNLRFDHYMENALREAHVIKREANSQNGCYTGVILSADEKRLVQEINRMAQVVHQIELMGRDVPRIGEHVRISYAAHVPTITKLQPELKQSLGLNRGLHV